MIVTPIPTPSAVSPGKKVVQYEPPTPGIARSTNAAAVSADPVTIGRRGPTRATSCPDHRLRRDTHATRGKRDAPAAAGE